MRGELDALGFAAGERGGGLAEADVAEADFVEHGELVDDLRMAGEEAEGFLTVMLRTSWMFLPL